MSPAAQEAKPWSIWASVLESSCLSMGRSHANIPSTHGYHNVCLSSHSNKGEKRSFGSSRSGNSADTMKSRCAGRRRGGAQNTNRYWEVASPHAGPHGNCSTRELWGVGHGLQGLLYYGFCFFSSNSSYLFKTSSAQLENAHASYPNQDLPWHTWNF